MPAACLARLLFAAHAVCEHENRRLLDVLGHHIGACGKSRCGARGFHEIDFGTIAHAKGTRGILRGKVQYGMRCLDGRQQRARYLDLLAQLGFLSSVRAADRRRRALESEHAPGDLRALRRFFHILHRREHAEAVEQHGRKHTLFGIHRANRRAADLLDSRHPVAL